MTTSAPPPAPLTFSAEEVAAHLRWQLANSNSEISRDDGSVIDVAFDAWDAEDGTAAFDLTVSGSDDNGRRGHRSFRVTVTPDGEDDTA